MPNSPMMKREPLQIVGTDLFGNAVIVWVERDHQGTVLSHLSEGMRLTRVVENPTGDVAVRLDRQKLHEHDGPKDFLVLAVPSDPFEHGLWTAELFGNGI